MKRKKSNRKRVKKNKLTRKINKSRIKKTMIFNMISTFITVIIAILTLYISKETYEVSKLSLKISESSLETSRSSLEISDKNYELSSKSMQPELDFEIYDKGINVTNNSLDLFKITTIEFIRVNRYKICKFDVNSNCNKTTQIYIPTQSSCIFANLDNREDKSIYYNFTEGTFGFGIKSDKDLSLQLDSYLGSFTVGWSMDMKSLLMSPSPALIPRYIVDEFIILKIGYENKFKDYRTSCFLCGNFYDDSQMNKIQIDKEKADEYVERCKVPEYMDFKDYWKIIFSDNKYLI